MKKITFLCFCFLLLSKTFVFAQSAAPKILSDTRSFEVTACAPFKNNLVTAWMEKRPQRKDNSEDATDMRIAYKASDNNGESWSEKGIIDMPDTFGNGNPFLTHNKKGNTYLVCMHIGQDFYSGNISLYEFDFAKKIFVKKSVPIKSSDCLLDKPAIVCNDNEMHLVYISYPKGKKNSVKYQYSNDYGATWSGPVDVFTNPSGSHLGPSIAILSNKQVAVSVGAYGGGKDIFFIKKKTDSDKIAFEKPFSIGKVAPELKAAMSELYTDGKKAVLSWQNPHQRNEVWMSVSSDDGTTWSTPEQIVKSGNLFSGVFDKKGNLHCIYSDFGNDSFSVGYKQFNAKNQVIKQSFIKEPKTLNGFTEYLGAFQKLLITNSELSAFWINYVNEHTLNFSHWKIH